MFSFAFSEHAFVVSLVPIFSLMFLDFRTSLVLFDDGSSRSFVPVRNSKYLKVPH